ncbi:MAG TPA: hypothetical protein VI248_06140 [Kineosporiaceae bacterium]
MSTLDWINVGAGVFSSLGTVGAFATGMVLLRREHQREEARAEDARRDQAVKVSAWIEAARTPSGGRELFFHVHNASRMPIYEVSVRNPVTEGDEPEEAEFIGLVPPGQTIRRPAPKEWLATYHSPEPVEIEFLDSSGHRWTRDEQGTLG